MFNLRSLAWIPRSTFALLFTLLLLGSGLTGPTSAQKPGDLRAYSPTPFGTFVKNHGQYPEEILFVGVGQDATYLITADSLVAQSRLATTPPEPTTRRDTRFVVEPPQSVIEGVQVEMRWDSASPDFLASAWLDGRVNYFKGSDPDAWVLDAPTFRVLRVNEAWPGVDVELSLNRGSLELSMIGQSARALGSASWDLRGADQLWESAGQIFATTGLGTLRLGNLSTRLEGFGASPWLQAASFATTTAPPSAMVSIGPFPPYSTFLGGAGDEVIYGLEKAPGTSSLQVLVSGSTNSSVIYPVLPGPYTLPQGAQDVFVARLPKTAGGANDFVWASYIGGSALDIGWKLAVEDDGDVHLTGVTLSTDFPTTAGALSSSLNGGANNVYPDAFALRLSDTGWILSSTYLGGSRIDVGFGIDVDSSGCAYITGSSDSANYPTTSGALSQVLNGNGILACVPQGGGTPFECPDAFVTKLDATGLQPVYSTFISGVNAMGLPEGAQQDQATGIRVDSAGRAHIAGLTNSPLMPVSANAHQPLLSNAVVPMNNDDGYVATLSADGTTLLHGTFLGGVEFDGSHEIDVHPTNSIVYVVGFAESCDFPTKNAYDATLGDGTICSSLSPRDATLTAYNWASGRMQFSTFLGGLKDDVAWDLELSGDGDIHFTGFTESVDFPTTAGVWDTTYNRKRDAFVSVFSANGATLLSSTYFGAPGDDEAYAIALNPITGWTHIAGQTTSSLLPLGLIPLDAVFNGPTEGFTAALETP